VKIFALNSEQAFEKNMNMSSVEPFTGTNLNLLTSHYTEELFLYAFWLLSVY
jgi:hypothetical protein